MEELRRQAGWAKTFGLPLELISAAEAKELFPLMSTDGVLGAAWLPTDGYLDPSQLTYALADGARREGGSQVFQNTRVTGIEVDAGRVRGGADRARADRGRGRRQRRRHVRGRDRPPGRGPGPDHPDVPPVPGHPAVSRARRRGPAADAARPRPARLLPRGRRRPGHGRLRARSPSRRSCPTGPSGSTAIPPDFNGRLLEDDWDRFAEITENSKRRVPAMDEVTITKLINGPEAFTPDNEFCLGESRGARLLRRRRLLRPRARRRRRDRPGDGRVDRRGRAEPRPLGDGHPPLRRPVPLAGLHPRPHP